MLSPEEKEFIQHLREKVVKLLPQITYQEVEDICFAKNFDRDEINKWCASLETQDKVKGLKAYEWNVVTSRKD